MPVKTPAEIRRIANQLAERANAVQTAILRAARATQAGAWSLKYLSGGTAKVWGTWGVVSRPPAGAQVLTVQPGRSGDDAVIAVAHDTERQINLPVGSVALVTNGATIQLDEDGRIQIGLAGGRTIEVTAGGDINLGSGGAAVARVGDEVDVTFEIGEIVVNGPGGTSSNTDTISTTGTISSGSSFVTAE